jgi:glucosamine--fructose-6-phosphate aminotransferase (isomerizing)
MAETHMRREIAEIPEATARLLDQAGSSALAKAGAEIRALDPRFLTTVARGSSDHAAAFLKYAIELTAGIPVASLGPSIASIYGVKLQLARSASIAVSQSGKSPDIVAMAKSARDGGALTIAITNTADSPLANASDHAIDIRAGAEKSVAATKTFVTSAVAGLAILGEWTAACRAWRLAGTFREGDLLRLDGDCRRAAEAQFAVHPWTWAVGGDRQRGGAEIQGDMRHACRGL